MQETVFLLLFYVTAAVAVVSTLLMITRTNAVHGLLYLIVSSLSLAIIFYLLGAPFAAALEVIIYAGAIMILFVFVVMMLNLGQKAVAQERQWLRPRGWIGPGLLAAVLFAVFASVLSGGATSADPRLVTAREVGIGLFGPYLLVVELASFLLLAGLIGAYHIARSPEKSGEGAATLSSARSHDPDAVPEAEILSEAAN